MVAVLIPSTLLMSIAAKLKQQAQLSTNSFRLRGFLLAVHKQEGCQKDIPAIHQLQQRVQRQVSDWLPCDDVHISKHI